MTGNALAIFVDNSETAVLSVEEALRLKDDDAVIIEGNIQKHLRKDKYLFSDGKNTMTVEISNHRWNGVDVTPDDKVRLTGKIDKSFNNIELEVKRLDVIR